jgi:hypothetical protein
MNLTPHELKHVCKFANIISALVKRLGGCLVALDGINFNDQIFTTVTVSFDNMRRIAGMATVSDSNQLLFLHHCLLIE